MRHLREYVRHRLIGTPLDPLAHAVRRRLTLWAIRRTPEIRDAMLEDDLLYQVVRRHVRDGMTCVDIGAHLGSMTRLFLTLSPSGRHTCVEPTPHKAAWLRRRWGKRVDVVEAALAETPGEVTFFHQERNSGYSGLAKHDAGVNDVSHVREMRVRCDTLDAIVPEDRRVGFVKVDVEGAELRVSRGGERVLTRDRPTVIFECTESGLSSSGFAAAELFEYLDARGYAVRTPRQHLEGGPPLDAGSMTRATRYPFAAFSFVASAMGA